MKSFWEESYEKKGLFIESKVDSFHNVFLEPKDFTLAKKLYDAEKIDSKDKMQLFRGLVYCIFTSSDSYDNQLYVLNQLQTRNMITPEKILQRKDELNDVLKRIIYNNSKKKHLISLCEDWWPKYDGLQCEINQAKSYKESGKNIREQLSDTCPGIGRKCGSLYLRMNGFMDCIPLDRWALRFLKFTGGINIDTSLDHRIHNGKKNNVRGPSKSQYLKYEHEFANFAETYNIRPAALQMILYRKKTNWITDSKIQTNLFEKEEKSFLHF